MADTIQMVPPSSRSGRGQRSGRHCPECKHRYGDAVLFCPFDGTRLEDVVWDPSADPLLGQVVDGRYEVQAVLGEGGMGIVYRVRHTSLDRLFALKALRPDAARDPDLAARFIQEARATASIRHPNVVQITDFGTVNDAPYFVMELLDGRSLAACIKAKGALLPSMCAEIGLKVAAALAAAHAAGVVHRDLKPENVFLLGRNAAEETPDDLRVVDFGAARILGTSRLTKTGFVFGTPHYMSPEQARGEAVDHRADIYALGVILYEMATGKVPFLADTYMGVLKQHMFEEPTPPSAMPAAHRELGLLEPVVMRALEKSPTKRYMSMTQLADDLRARMRLDAEGRRATTVRPDGLVAREDAPGEDAVAGLSPRGSGAMRAAIVAMLGIGLAGGIAFWLAHRPAPEADRAAPGANTATPSQTTLTASSTSPANPGIPPPEPAASAPQQTPGTVTVRVSAKPQAEVWADNARLGTTPFALSMAPDASRKVTLRAHGYESRDIDVDAKTPELAFELTKLAAASPPGTAGPPPPQAPARNSAHTAGTRPTGDFADPWAK